MAARTRIRALSSVAAAPSKSSSDRLNQAFNLACGRRLGYAEYGPANGRPLFYLHGFPSSRLEPWALGEAVLKKGVRLICPDRPGFGLSTLRPIAQAVSEHGKRADYGSISSHMREAVSRPIAPRAQHIADYPRDVLALADHLNLSTFGILGGSGGGPFALACAYPNLGIPPHRLTAVGLMASGGPWNVSRPSPPLESAESTTRDPPVIREDELKRDVLWSSYILYLGVWYAPTITRWILDGAVRMARWLLAKEAVQRRLDGVIGKSLMVKAANGSADTQDGALTGLPAESSTETRRQSAREIRENASATVLESFRQGASGAVHEARLLTGDWGFALDGTDGQGPGVKVSMWHGAKDVNAPIAQIRYMAQRIPGCQLKEYDEDHFRLVRHMEDILDELLQPS